MKLLPAKGQTSVGAGAQGSFDISHLLVAQGQQYGQAGKTYLLNATASATGLSPADITKIANYIGQGDYGVAALQSETLLLSTYGGPIGVALGALIVGIEALYGADHPSPATVPGCESTYHLPALPQGNPFTWAAIGSQFEYVPPQGSIPALTFSNNGLIDWGSPGFLCDPPPGKCLPTAGIDPTKAGGPGSFEEALERAVMSLWDQTVTAPNVCQMMSGTDGNIGYGGGNLRAAIFNAAMAAVGAMIPGFVVAWNASHQAGTITVSATPGTCPKGSVYTPGNSGSNGTCATPAPQRMIQYTVGGTGMPVSTDPLAMAFQGLAQLAKLPEGSVIAVAINSGPAGTAATAHDTNALSGISGWHPAAKVALGVVATAAVAAGGVGIWALLTQQAYGEAWSRVLGHVVEQSRASGALLIEADPLKGAKLLGAGEPKKRRGTTKIQSVLIPRDRFTRAQADAWMRRPEQRARGLKIGRVDPTENYFRYRQFSPSKKTVVGTIAFGDSGIKAIVAR